jgi:hypothetical protein
MLIEATTGCRADTLTLLSLRGRKVSCANFAAAALRVPIIIVKKQIVYRR